MLTELLLRFAVGGLVVSAFSVVGELLRPRSFAGIFGAAPSVALATLGLTFARHPPDYIVTEGRSMVAGGIAFVAYSLLGGWLVGTVHWPTWVATGAAWGLWLVVGIGLWAVLLR